MTKPHVTVQGREKSELEKLYAGLWGHFEAPSHPVSGR